MNFICPKCGCSYESDTAKCPYCGFAPKKHTQPVESRPAESERRDNSIFRVFGAFAAVCVLVFLFAFLCGADIPALTNTPLGQLILILLFPPLFFLL